MTDWVTRSRESRQGGPVGGVLAAGWPFGSPKKVGINHGSPPGGGLQLGDTLSSGAALVSRDARAALVKDLNQGVRAFKGPRVQSLITLQQGGDGLADWSRQRVPLAHQLGQQGILVFQGVQRRAGAPSCVLLLVAVMLVYTDVTSGITVASV